MTCTGPIVRHRETQAVHQVDELGVDPVHFARTEIAQDVVDLSQPDGDVVSVLPVPCGQRFARVGIVEVRVSDRCLFDCSRCCRGQQQASGGERPTKEAATVAMGTVEDFASHSDISSMGSPGPSRAAAIANGSLRAQATA